MKDLFNVQAFELMDFQMISDEGDIVMAAFHPKGILRLIAFSY